MPATHLTPNTLFYGDNLDILRDHIPTASVDLVYLDPPFNSNRNYNVLFKDEHGKESESQITAFEDTWHWNAAAERTYYELVTNAPERVGTMIGAMRQFIGTNQMMAYLVMMAARLVELHRVLKPTGSLYLHCDPTASHYLRMVLDTIFDPRNFRNEIVWRRYGSHNDVGQGSQRFGRVHDIILFYAKSETPTWNQLFTPLDAAYIASTYRQKEAETGRQYATTPLTGPGGAANRNPVYEWNGHTRAWRYSRETMQRLEREGRLAYSKTGYVRQKLYLDESKGVPVQDEWTDIPSLSGSHAERLGYPTQKPLALLERMILSSTNPGDIVLDPFCGCGTAVAAAHKLERKWVGIDITHLAIALQRYRMEQMYPGIAFDVVGEPEDIGAARYLAERDRYQFQWWALSLLRARPLGAPEGSKVGKKGSDRGIDGLITFVDDAAGTPRRVPVQVKSGHVKSGDVRDLRGTLEREQAAMGVFVTLEEPSRDMRTEAAAAGVYHSANWGTFPKLQILTIEELLRGKTVEMPRPWGTFKEAPRAELARGEQHKLDL